MKLEVHSKAIQGLINRWSGQSHLGERDMPDRHTTTDAARVSTDKLDEVDKMLEFRPRVTNLSIRKPNQFGSLQETRLVQHCAGNHSSTRVLPSSSHRARSNSPRKIDAASPSSACTDLSSLLKVHTTVQQYAASPAVKGAAFQSGWTTSRTERSPSTGVRTRFG